FEEIVHRSLVSGRRAKRRIREERQSVAGTVATAAWNGAALLRTAAVQPRVEGEGAAGQIDRRAKPQSPDESLKVLGAFLPAALEAILNAKDNNRRPGQEQQGQEQDGAS